MDLQIDVHLAYETAAPTDLLLQIEVADVADQVVSQPVLTLSQDTPGVPAPAEVGLGRRLWLHAVDSFKCTYSAQVTVDRPLLDLGALSAVRPRDLPGDTVRFLMPSRFCPSDKFQSLAASEFGHLEGGQKIVAMRDWINGSIAYVPGASDGQTTAIDTYVQRQGVCRDFAHVMIALARASTIPARFASVYAPGVTPQDFHAVAEVFLEGTWHLVDATGMAPADTIARIGVGLDAAETAFLTAFGAITLVEQTVSVVEVQGR